MSNIQKMLAYATEIEPSKRANETITDQAYLMRLALGVQKLSNEDWDKLDSAAKDWFNKAADSIESKSDIHAFPDIPQAEEPSTRRRGAAAEPGAAPFTSKDAKKGDAVVVTTKRGRTIEGKVVEADDQGLVLEDGEGKDVELDHDKIESIKLAGGKAAADPVVPDVAQVGDTVQVTTKRGKVVMGNIKELTDKDIVLVDVAGEIHEFDLDRLDGGITVKAKAPAGGRGRGASEAKAEVKSNGATSAADPAKTPRASTAANGGVSVTGRIRELIADDLTSTKEAISAQMKKDGLEFKQATLDLTYGDMHKIIGVLRDRKVIK